MRCEQYNSSCYTSIRMGGVKLDICFRVIPHYFKNHAKVQKNIHMRNSEALKFTYCTKNSQEIDAESIFLDRISFYSAKNSPNACIYAKLIINKKT